MPKKTHRHRVALRKRHAFYQWRSFFQGAMTWSVRLFFVCLSLWLGATAYAFWVRSPWLQIQDVQVSASAPKNLLEKAGVFPGDHLFGFSAQKTVLSIETAYPELSHVSVQRGWDRTVRIHFELRRPEAKVYQKGRWLGMDASGALFPLETVAASNKKLMILSNVPEGDKAKPVLFFSKCLGNMLISWAQSVYKIKLTAGNDVLLYLQNNLPVFWGELSQDENQIMKKAMRLERVLDDDALVNGVDYIRFVEDRRIVVKPKKILDF